MESSSEKVNENVDVFVGRSLVKSQIFGWKEQVILFFSPQIFTVI